MGMFDFARGWHFFHGRDTDGLTADDLDFQKWTAAHRDWRRRLTEYIQSDGKGKVDELAISRDDRCELGAWIHGSGKRFYGELPVFGKLRDHHADFHRSAGHVVNVFKREGRQAANKVLNAEFDLRSLRVVEHLESLEHQIKTPRT